jgi:hypothetical protein
MWGVMIAAARAEAPQIPALPETGMACVDARVQFILFAPAATLPATPL